MIYSPMVGGKRARLVAGGRCLLITTAAWLLGLQGWAHADHLQACRELRHQRDDLASRAMEEELLLVRKFRERLCPGLAQQAEVANARDLGFSPINFAAWNRCRRDAEQQLEASHTIRYRNRQGFTFYTASGAMWAAQADQLSNQWQEQGCL